MRLFFTLLISLALAALVWSIEMRLDRAQDKKIEALETRVDALQLTAAGRIPVAEFDGVPVLRPKVIKY